MRSKRLKNLSIPIKLITNQYVKPNVMKANRKDIMDELQSLEASFLLKEKVRTSQDENFLLHEEFYQSVMNQVETKEIPIISISQEKKSYTRIWRIAASFVVLLSVVGLIYAIVPKMSTQEESLQQLLAETSSQDILDYLYETGVPTDEEFILEYVGSSFETNE